MIYILIQDFQHTTSDGQILLLKKGAKIDRRENDYYIISLSRKEYKIKAIIVEKNPLFFHKVDLKTQILSILKTNNKRTAPKLAELLSDFFIKEHLEGKDYVDVENLRIMLEACRLQYLLTKDEKWLLPIHNLKWDVDVNGVFKN